MSNVGGDCTGSRAQIRIRGSPQIHCPIRQYFRFGAGDENPRPHLEIEGTKRRAAENPLQGLPCCATMNELPETGGYVVVKKERTHIGAQQMSGDEPGVDKRRCATGGGQFVRRRP